MTRESGRRGRRSVTKPSAAERDHRRSAVFPARQPQPLGLSGPLGQRLEDRRDEVLDVMARHGVDRVDAFGSVDRGTDGPRSDVDLLVDVPAGTGLFTLGRLRHELEDLLACSVDVVPSDGLRKHVRDEVAQDAIPLTRWS